MAQLSNPLKIGLVLDSGLDKPDGVQQYVLTVGEWLRAQGHDVQYLVGETKRHDIKGLHSLGHSILVSFNGNTGSIPLIVSRTAIRRLLDAEKFDVLHVQVPHHPFLAQRAILAADKRTAVIGTFHIAPYNKLVSLANRGLGLWLRPSLRRFDRIVSVSTAAQAFACETFGIETDVVPNVIDYARFHNAKPLSQYDDQTPTILFLGRLVPRKGCQLLLEAVRIMVDQGGVGPFRVIVCGKGALRAKLEEYVTQHQLESFVKFTGFVNEDDKPRYYASADITVFPSSGGESFGIVLPEAMASGRSVVLAGDNPGYRAVMSPRPELLFDPHDARALADKLSHYLKTPVCRKKAQAWGADYARSFDVNTVGAELMNIYREALRKRRDA